MYSSMKLPPGKNTSDDVIIIYDVPEKETRDHHNPFIPRYRRLKLYPPLFDANGNLEASLRKPNPGGEANDPSYHAKFDRALFSNPGRKASNAARGLPQHNTAVAPVKTGGTAPHCEAAISQATKTPAGVKIVYAKPFVRPTREDILLPGVAQKTDVKLPHPLHEPDRTGQVRETYKENRTIGHREQEALESRKTKENAPTKPTEGEPQRQEEARQTDSGVTAAAVRELDDILRSSDQTANRPMEPETEILEDTSAEADLSDGSPPMVRCASRRKRYASPQRSLTSSEKHRSAVANFVQHRSYAMQLEAKWKTRNFQHVAKQACLQKKRQVDLERAVANAREVCRRKAKEQGMDARRYIPKSKTIESVATESLEKTEVEMLP